MASTQPFLRQHLESWGRVGLPGILSILGRLLIAGLLLAVLLPSSARDRNVGRPLPGPAQYAVLQKMAAGHWEEALALARPALARAPDDLVLLDQTATLFGKRSAASEGTAFLDAVLDSAAHPGLWAFGRATLQLELGRYDAALSRLDQAEGRFLASGNDAARLLFLYRKGDALKRSQRDAEATPILEEASGLGAPGGLVHYQLAVLDLLATILSRTGSLERSARLARQGVGLAAGVSDRAMEMSFHQTLAAGAYRQARYREAREEYRRAADLAAAAGDARARSRHLRRVGDCSARLGDPQTAADLYARAAAAARQAGAGNEEADVLCALAGLRLQQGNPAEALKLGERAARRLDEERAAGGRVWSSVLFRAHSMQALALEAMGRIEEAIAAHRKNERLLPRLRPSYRNSHRNNLATCLTKLGELDQALALYEDDLRSSRARKDRREESLALGNLASVYRQQGRYEEALESFRQGRAIAEAACDLEILARFLRDEADLHVLLAEEPQARQLLRESLELARTGGYSSQQAACLTALADLGRREGDYEEARRDLERALPIARKTGSPERIERVLRNLGLLAVAQGDEGRARRIFRRALSGEEGPVPLSLSALLLTDLGGVELRRSNFDAARGLFTRADSVAQRIQSPGIRVGSLIGLARAQKHLGRPEEALRDYREAVRAVEAIRRGTGAEEQRWKVFAAYTEAYREAALLLVTRQARDDSTAHLEEALRFSEMCHARTFLDRIEEAGVHMDEAVPAALRRRRRENLERAGHVHSLLVQALDRRGTSAGTIPGEPEGEGSVDSLRDSLERLDREYTRIEGRIRQALRPHLGLRFFAPVSPDRLREALAPAELFLEFLSTDAGWIVFSVSRDRGLMAQTIEPGVTAKAKELRALLEAGSASPVDELGRFAGLAHALYQSLIAPALRAHGSGFRSLIVVPDEELWTIPLEATLTRATGPGEAERPGDLPYLFRSLDLVYVPSAASWMFDTGGNGRARPSRTGGSHGGGIGRTLVLADPAYALPEGAAAGAAPAGAATAFPQASLFGTLDQSRFEGEEIAGLLGSDRVDLLTGGEATEEQMKSLDLTRYSRIHLAAHSVLDPDHPLLSAVVLAQDADPSEDGFITIREIYRLHLDADLVVLSACSSAGGKVVRGEGVIALARGFLAAGARSTLVSLWPVEDAATRTFMDSFYAAVAQGAGNEEALHTARDSMLHSDRPAFRLPRHWASFVLLGAPRPPIAESAAVTPVPSE